VGDGPRLVRGEVDDANEGVHGPVPFVHQHLLDRLLGRFKVKVRLQKQALCEIEVPSFEFSVGHLDALRVGPFDGQVVQSLVEQVAQQRFPPGLEVGFVHRNHGHTSGLGESPSSGYISTSPVQRPPLVSTGDWGPSHVGPRAVM